MIGSLFNRKHYRSCLEIEVCLLRFTMTSFSTAYATKKDAVATEVEQYAAIFDDSKEDKGNKVQSTQRINITIKIYEY
jgi:hypothetical protein